MLPALPLALAATTAGTGALPACCRLMQGGLMGTGLNLVDISNYLVERGSFDPGMPTRNAQSSGPASGMSLAAPLPDEYRVVSLSLYILGGAGFSGGDWATQAANENALEALLLDAALAQGPYGKGTPVALVYAEPGSRRLVYFDVITGTLQRTKDQFTNVAAKYTLTLYCFPYLRADAYSTPAYPVQAGSPTVTVPAVPGDVEALTRVIVTDTAVTNAATLSGMILGRRSYRPLPANAFSALVLATLGGDAQGAIGVGTLGSDPSSLSGAPVTYVATPVQVWNVALFTPPQGAAYEHGLFDVLLRVRDHTQRLLAPTLTSINTGAVGSSGQTVLWQVTCCAQNAAGYFGPPLAAFAFTGDANSTYGFSFASGGGETPAHYVLFANVTNYSTGVATGWKSTTGGSGGSATFGFENATLTSGATFTAAVPPSFGSGEPLNTCYLTPMTQVQPFSVAQTWQNDVVFGQTVQPVVGNGIWELLKLGTLSLPPQVRLGALPDQPATLALAVQSGNGSSAAVDLDAIYLVPHGDEEQLALSANLPNQPPAQTWVAETRQDGRTAALLYSQTVDPPPGLNPATVNLYGGVASFATAQGRFTLGPGDNVVVWVPYATGSGPATFYPQTSNISSTATIRFDVTPRYRNLAGALAEVWQ